MRPLEHEIVEMLAPERVGVDTRDAFRDAALERLALMTEGGGRLVVDLTHTHYIDTAGLGVLAMIQRRAQEGGNVVELKNPNQEIQFSLVLSKLDGLFEITTDPV